ncbi:MAG: hypothetical protein ABJ387_09405 [Balneola sp.]
MTSPQPKATNWSITQKLIFRIIFSYIVLYVVLMFAVVFLETPLKWFAQNIIHWGQDLQVRSTGSGDQTYNFVLISFNLFLVLIIVPIWSFFDRKRDSYSTLLHWLFLFLRIVLFCAMLLYGSVKLVKGQFPDHSLYRLLQPLGEMSPMGLAWTFMGHSFMYNLFIGFAEVLGGLLMLYRKTVTLGSLVIIGVMSNVAMMNMTYDIPVKLFSFHLLLMAFVLLSKDFNRLVNFFLKNETAQPVQFYTYFKNSGIRKFGSVIRGLIAFIVLATTLIQIFLQFNIHDQLKEKSEFYGIWKVETFTDNGVGRPPLTTDTFRWEYLIIDQKKKAIVKKMDGSRMGYDFALDTTHQKIDFMSLSGSYKFNYSMKNDSNYLKLNSLQNVDSLSITLRRKPLSDFRLINHEFRWVNEFPFNR